MRLQQVQAGDGLGAGDTRREDSERSPGLLEKTSMSVIKFGTDGWRAAIAEDFTFANVRLCAQAVSEYLKENGDASRGLVVGYDTRFASEHFAATVAEVSTANGIRTYLCDRNAPT